MHIMIQYAMHRLMTYATDVFYIRITYTGIIDGHGLEELLGNG